MVGRVVGRGYSLNAKATTCNLSNPPRLPIIAYRVDLRVRVRPGRRTDDPRESQKVRGARARYCVGVGQRRAAFDLAEYMTQYKQNMKQRRMKAQRQQTTNLLKEHKS